MTKKTKKILTGKPSLEVTPTTFAKFGNTLADREFSAACYLFAVSNSDLLFRHRMATSVRST